jgi:integrase
MGLHRLSRMRSIGSVLGWSVRVGKVKMRYLVTRQRKAGPAHYWVPYPHLVKAGFEIARLSDDPAEAFKEAGKLNARLDAWYDGVPLEPAGTAPWSLQALDDLFQTDVQFTDLAPRTQRDYCYSIKPALNTFGVMPAAAISTVMITTWLRTLIAERGGANARNTGAALRRLLSFGRNQGWIKDNPATSLRLPTPASRFQVWTLAEVEQFSETAIAEGHTSMALAAVLGWCLGQRPADLRTLAWSAYDGRSITLRQAKTKREIKVPCLPELRRVLDVAKRTSPVMVVSETTNRPYQESAFQHTFAILRGKAGLPGDRQFRDFRRTVASQLGAAGCTEDQIMAVTGHRSRSVLARYIVPNDTFAKGAMVKLERARRTKT